ncbi:TolB-like translocation protein [Streptomyces sp. NPDC049954]|uniref:TolB family protein n=1 Tax=Streptomyces sp. NPDC049954 TaxID=3155779 RepID=UPI0034438E2F
MSHRGKFSVLVAVVLVLAVVATVSVLRASARADRRDQARPDGPRVTTGEVGLGPGARRMVFRNMAWGPHRDELASTAASAPAGTRTATAGGLTCLRFHAASGTGVCLQAVHGALTDTYRATVVDARLHEGAHYPVPGIPSRARVSPSGRYAAWTAFVGGDSYAGTDFSTRTAILDTRTGKLTPSLEVYGIVKDGRRYRSADVNFWGVTFERDDRHFYATLATGRKTYLVRGDMPTRTVTVLHQNVECPSLSPDGTRIVYKKRVAGLPADAPWRLYALDLRTMRETALAESRSVDDQAVWSDDRHVTYALPGDFGADLYTVPADGRGTPHELVKAAVSPVYL